MRHVTVGYVYFMFYVLLRGNNRTGGPRIYDTMFPWKGRLKPAHTSRTDALLWTAAPYRQRDRNPILSKTEQA